MKFDSQTEPSQRLVQGLPYHDTRGSQDPEKYGKVSLSRVRGKLKLNISTDFP